MKTNVAIVRDHSASMRGLRKAALSDYNLTLDGILETSDPRDTLVSVVECGVGVLGEVRVACRPTTVLEVLRENKYSVSGSSTPLFDSVAQAIDQAQLFSTNDVAYLVLVITDGQENSSRRWNAQKISSRIKLLQDTGRWTFVFRVPRGQRGYLTNMGIPSGNVMEWEQTTAALESSTQQTVGGLKSYFSARKTGTTSTGSFFASLDGVSTTTVKRELTETRGYDLYHVPALCDGMQIIEFCMKFGPKQYDKGHALYQLTKPEKQVQDYKDICIRSQRDGKMYAGTHARNLLGIPDVGTVKLAPGKLGKWDVFIQSTSSNRKLVGGTTLLYKK